MKKLFFNTGTRAGIMICFLLFCSPVYLKAADVVRFTNGEWPPLLSPDMKDSGYVSKIITAAYALENLTVEYGFFSWKRAFELAKSGEWDGSVVWTCKPEWEKAFYCSAPIALNQIVFFHRKDRSFDWNTLDDLKGKLVGVTNGYYYGADFETYEKKGTITTDYAYDDETSLKKLLYERTDVFLLDRDVGYYMIKKNFKPEEQKLFTHHARPLIVNPLVILMSRKNSTRGQNLLKIFNSGFKKLQQQGDIKAIREEFGIKINTN